MTDPRALPDQRNTLRAALAFGGFVNAEETERVALWAERRIEQLEAALREIDRCCSFGADREGMTAMGVKDLRRQISRALDENGERA